MRCADCMISSVGRLPSRPSNTFGEPSRYAIGEKGVHGIRAAHPRFASTCFHNSNSASAGLGRQLTMRLKIGYMFALVLLVYGGFVRRFKTKVLAALGRICQERGPRTWVHTSKPFISPNTTASAWRAGTALHCKHGHCDPGLLHSRTEVHCSRIFLAKMFSLFPGPRVLPFAVCRFLLLSVQAGDLCFSI